jgi:peptidoglycan/xylan/chitin deacetylase (PgdA/CDA1 family)
VSSTQRQGRPRFASRKAKHRRRRRLALAGLVIAIAVPVLVLTAFQSSGSSKADAPSGGRWKGGKVVKKRTGAGEGAGLVSVARQRAAVARLFKLGLPIYCAGGTGHYVALTFDDGPSEHTPGFLDVLRNAGARATFFIVGGNMVSEELASYARADTKLGALGDHTWTHANLVQLSDADVVDQIGRAKRAIKAATHAPVLFFRPPFAARNATVARVAASFGLVQILWNVDSRDWTGQPAGTTANIVLQGLKPGAIILMHDTRPNTIDALRYTILPTLKLRGLRAVTLPELFALDPPSTAQVRKDAAAGACSRGQIDQVG